MELDLVMRPSGSPALVLRCAARAECPPACDQACRHLAEAVTSPVRALIVLPAGSDVPDLVD